MFICRHLQHRSVSILSTYLMYLSSASTSKSAYHASYIPRIVFYNNAGWADTLDLTHDNKPISIVAILSLAAFRELKLNYLQGLSWCLV